MSRSVCTKISGCFDNICINFRQYIVNRKYDKGRKLYTIPRTMADGVLMIDCSGKMEEIKYAVNDSVFFQKCLPR